MVNYDLPVVHNQWIEPDYEVYLHRVGRAGRFGRKGMFILYVSWHLDVKLPSLFKLPFF